MSSYVSVIKNELGEIVCYTKDYTEKEIDTILANHEEYTLSCVPIEDEFYMEM